MYVWLTVDVNMVTSCKRVSSYKPATFLSTLSKHSGYFCIFSLVLCLLLPFFFFSMANPAVCFFCCFVCLSVYCISILGVRAGQLFRFQFECQLWSIMILASPITKTRLTGECVMPHVLMCGQVLRVHSGRRILFIHRHMCMYGCVYIHICQPKEDDVPI